MKWFGKRDELEVQLEGIFRRLRKILRTLGARRSSVPHYFARKMADDLAAKGVNSRGFDAIQDEIRSLEKRASRIQYYDAICLLVIAVNYFGLDQEVRLPLVDLKLTDVVLSLALATTSILNVELFLLERARRDLVLLLDALVEKVPGIDNTGVRHMFNGRFGGFMPLVAQYQKEGQIDAGGNMFLLYLLYSVPILLVLPAVALIPYVVISSAWDVGVRNAWSTIYVMILLSVVVSYLSRLIGNRSYRHLQMEFCRIGISQTLLSQVAKVWPFRFNVLVAR